MSPIQKKDVVKKVTSPEEELDEEHTLAEAGFEEAKNHQTPSPSSPAPQGQRQSTGHFVAPIPEDFLSGDGSFLNVINNNLGL